MKKFIVLFLFLSVLLLSIGVSADSHEFKVSLNGAKLDFAQSPVIVNDTILVPVRTFMDDIGGTTEWEEDSQSVLLEFRDKSITFKINDINATVNGNILSLSAAPQLINGTSMVPVRFIAENLGCDIAWLDFANTVYVGVKQENFNYDVSLTYAKESFPSPVGPTSYYITIDGSGRFIETYTNTGNTKYDSLVKYLS